MNQNMVLSILLTCPLILNLNNSENALTSSSLRDQTAPFFDWRSGVSRTKFEFTTVLPAVRLECSGV